MTLKARSGRRGRRFESSHPDQHRQMPSAPRLAGLRVTNQLVGRYNFLRRRLCHDESFARASSK